MEVCVGGGGGGRLYTYRYTVTTRMTYALRWAMMRAILMFHNCEGQTTTAYPLDMAFDSQRSLHNEKRRISIMTSS